MPPLSAPRILVEDQGLLLLAAVPWRVRPSPWVLEPDIAGALGAFFRSGAIDGPDGPRGPAHGDFVQGRCSLQQPPGDPLAMIDRKTFAIHARMTRITLP